MPFCKTYQKLSKKDEVYQRCAQKIQDAFGVGSGSGNSTGSSFARFYTHMGKTSSEQLQIQMAAVDKFVEDTKLSAKNE